jgi:hypothetical protein
MQFSPQLRIDAETQLAVSYVSCEIFARNRFASARELIASLVRTDDDDDDENNRRLSDDGGFRRRKMLRVVFTLTKRARMEITIIISQARCVSAPNICRGKHHFCARRNNDVLLLSRFSCSLRIYVTLITRGSTFRTAK